MPTGKQIRAARVFLDWDAADLAARVGLRRETILSIEKSLSQPRQATMDKIVQIFNDSGVEFKAERGVELRDDKIREIDGPDCYARLLDEISYQLQKGEEFLVASADERLSSPEVHAAHKRIVAKGIRYRKLIRYGNTHICGPLAWYRWIDARYYQNAAAVFFLDRSAYLTGDFKKVIIVRDKAITKANRNFFEMAWTSSTTPTKTTANEHYK